MSDRFNLVHGFSLFDDVPPADRASIISAAREKRFALSGIYTLTENAPR